jgi:predicted metalloprotease
MANWNKLSGLGKVVDRRGTSGGGLGIIGIILVLGLTYLTGGDVITTALNLGTQELSQNNLTEQQRAQFEGFDEYEEFSSLVLGSLDQYWEKQLPSEYIPPTLVLFRNQTQSSCGGASSVTGPHYCPLDETIYLDETFFMQLTDRYGARGGDVAEAYVIAHEVGHHVQNLQGLLNGRRDNDASIAVELNADCYAGAWAGSIADDNVFGPGEIIEALDAAAAIGDDNIQQRTTGIIQPESWTHGSSDQRRSAFTLGYQNPENPGVCLD